MEEKKKIKKRREKEKEKEKKKKRKKRKRERLMGEEINERGGWCRPRGGVGWSVGVGGRKEKKERKEEV